MQPLNIALATLLWTASFALCVAYSVFDLRGTGVGYWSVFLNTAALVPTAIILLDRQRIRVETIVSLVRRSDSCEHLH